MSKRENARRRIMLGLAPAALSILLIGKAEPVDALVVFDDFTDGNADMIGLSTQSETSQTVYQQGPGILGEARRITYKVVVPPASPIDTAAGWLELLPDKGLLVVSNDYKTNHRVALRYGFDELPGRRLNEDFTGFDQISLNFDGIDQGLNINIIMCSNTCTDRAQVGTTVTSQTHSQIGRNFPVTVDFRMHEFVPHPEGDFDLSNVNYMTVVLQSRGAILSDDYALSQVVAQ